ncbi:MAG: S8 family serine peptidase, partial [Limisphaerales bacterium]
MSRKPAPADTLLKVTVYPQDKEKGVAEFKREPDDRSPFGPIFIVSQTDLVAMAQLPFVQQVEPFHRRTLLNDLTRVAVGVSANSSTAPNYLGLTGTNVLVNINDTGVDATHPDLAGRVIADVPPTLTDTNGHGTHVAGIIASSGSNSPVLLNTNTIPGSFPGASFRGKAPAARLFAMPVDLITGPFISDEYLQVTAAKTNAFISNNSWGYVFDNGYN